MDTGRGDLEQFFRELELELMRPEIRASPESLALLLAEDFREFGSSGSVFTKSDVTSALSAESPPRISISDFCVTVLSTESALVTYRAMVQRAGSDCQVASLRSSVWVFRNARWQILFHHGTR